MTKYLQGIEINLKEIPACELRELVLQFLQSYFHLVDKSIMLGDISINFYLKAETILSCVIIIFSSEDETGQKQRD